MNPLANFKQWYTPNEEKKRGRTVFGLNDVILIKVKVQSINDAALPTRDSNKFRGDAIRLGAVYVCDDSYDEIMDTIFQGNN